MTYDFIPQIIIGIILMIVGAKLPLNFGAALWIRLALVVIGLAFLIWGILNASTQLSL